MLILWLNCRSRPPAHSQRCLPPVTAGIVNRTIPNPYNHSPIPGPIKSVFFLMFLFAIGYSVGPQFFRALRGSGIRQVIFAAVMCVLCFAVTAGVA